MKTYFKISGEGTIFSTSKPKVEVGQYVAVYELRNGNRSYRLNRAGNELPMSSYSSMQVKKIVKVYTRPQSGAKDIE